MKLAYIDVETTGLDPTKHCLWSLAVQVVIDGHAWQPFEIQVQPLEDAAVDPEALAIGGMDLAALEGFREPRKGLEFLQKELKCHVAQYDRQDKLFFVGYNASFDANFVRQWFLRQGDDYFGSWFWHPPLDVMGYAAIKLASRRPHMPNFKLATVAKELSIEVDDSRTHDAGYDLEITREIFRRLHKEPDSL